MRERRDAPEDGLTDAEADRRREQLGANELTQAARDGWFRTVMAQFR